MEYTYTTTKEMDEALAEEATNQNTTPEALFNIIVTADMGTLVRNRQDQVKSEMADAYLLADDKDKKTIDDIVKKVKEPK